MLKVEIWSDVVCPWCYIGKRRFEAALARFQHRDQVEVLWRSFELDPGASTVLDGTGYVDLLAGKYSLTREAAQRMLDDTARTAAGEGLDYRFDLMHRANTFAAHQVVHLAAAQGLQDPMEERLFRAHFTEGADVDDRATLVRLAGEVGIPAAEVGRALDSGSYAEAVRADEAEAATLGISGVPFFVVDRRYGVSGAQPADQLLAVLGRAWDERQPLEVVGHGGSEDRCGPDGCPV